MFFRKIVRLFESGNVSVFGLRGRGKDMLTANVVVRRKLPYVSNVDYGGDWYPLDFEAISIGHNSYNNFIIGKLNRYVFPYPDKTDVYISDAGIYLPSQYCNELNKQYKYLPTFFAISRHLGLSNVHVNSQALNRVWDKIREQSDIYICCMKCKVIGKLVFQKIRLYEKYESAEKCVPPFRWSGGLFSNKFDRALRNQQKTSYEITYGKVKSKILIYFNKSKYNTRLFKTLLEGGACLEKN